MVKDYIDCRGQPCKIVFSLKHCVAHVNFILGIAAICLRYYFHARLDFERKTEFFKVANSVNFR